MKISARSVLMAGVTALTATAVAAAPSVQPLPHPQSESVAQFDVQLTAQQQNLLQVLRTSPVRLLGPAEPIGSLPPSPTPTAIAIAPNLANTIDSIYIAVEPWVRYGFQVAASAVAWIPVVGWASGQIMIFYNFGQSIVASGVFNFTDWLRGQGGIVQNLVDFGVDVGLAFVWLGLDEVNFFIPLPPIPLPPRPPLQGPFAAFETALAPTDPAEVQPTNAASNLVDAVYIPIRNGIDYGVDVLPLGINSYVDGALAMGATTVRSVVNTGINEVNYIAGFPLLPPVNASASQVDRTSEVGSVPSLVKTPLAHSDFALGEVTETLRDARDDARADVVKRRTAAPTPDDLGNVVARTHGEVRGAVTNAATDLGDAARTPVKPADEVTRARSAVANGLRETARQITENVRQAAKDVRNVASGGSTDDE